MDNRLRGNGDAPRRSTEQGHGGRPRNQLLLVLRARNSAGHVLALKLGGTKAAYWSIRLGRDAAGIVGIACFAAAMEQMKSLSSRLRLPQPVKLISDVG